MRALITGGSGFVGQWLTRALLQRGYAVDLSGLGVSLNGPTILDADERRAVRWIPADIRDTGDVELVFERTQPEVVFHLAGVSFPPDAERSPTTTYDVNALGVVRLLSAIRRKAMAVNGGAGPTIVVVGSGVQYGAHPASEMPLTEDAVQRPLTTYAASKAAQEIAALQFHDASRLRVICTRSFNHSGVGHASQYLVPSLIARARQIVAGGEPRLALGNDVVRDYLHVTDVVAAYIALAERGRAGEVYNVCSGHGVSARELATAVLLRVGATADITTEAALVRPSDIPVLIGSPTKLVAETGWSPTKTHTDIIDDLLHAATD